MARVTRSLNGTVVAITGGGRGIGRAIGQAAAREGARVALGDLDRASAETAAAGLGGDALGLALDVTDHAGFTEFLDEVERRLGPLDVLVNNAGIMVVKPLVEESSDSVARQIDLNLRAVIHGTQEAMRRMVPRGTGHIVNVSSLAGRSGFAMLGTYAATKHGVVGLSEAARAELRGTGVEITVVMPYFVRTELTAGVRGCAHPASARARGRCGGGSGCAPAAAIRRLRPPAGRRADEAGRHAAAGTPRRARPRVQRR